MPTSNRLKAGIIAAKPTAPLNEVAGKEEINSGLVSTVLDDWNQLPATFLLNKAAPNAPTPKLNILCVNVGVGLCCKADEIYAELVVITPPLVALSAV